MLLAQKGRDPRQLGGIRALAHGEAPGLKGPVHELGAGRAAARPDRVEKVGDLLVAGFGRVRDLFGEINAGEGFADRAATRDVAVDTAADVVRAFITHDLQRHARHDFALKGRGAVRLQHRTRQRGQKTACCRAEAHAHDVRVHSLPFDLAHGVPPLQRVVQRLGNHHLRERLGGTVFGQTRAGQRGVHFRAQLLESGGRVIRRHAVAVDQLGADAADFAHRTRDLHVGQIRKGVEVAFDLRADDRVLGAFRRQLLNVRNERAGGQQPADRVGHGEKHAVALALRERATVDVLGRADIGEHPAPQLEPLGQRVKPRAGLGDRKGAQLGGPLLDLGLENLVVHRHADLAALHHFRALVRGLQLRVGPLVEEEAGAVLGDAVAAHQADGLAQHVRAVAGGPQLGRRAEHVADGAQPDVRDERVGLELGNPDLVSRAFRLSLQAQELDGFRLGLAQGFHQGAAAAGTLFGEEAASLVLDERELVKSAGGLKAERGSSLARRPHVGEAVNRILLHLDAEVVAGRAGFDAGRAAVAAALVADDRLDGRKQLGRGH